MSGLVVALAIYVIVGNFFCSSSFRLEQFLLLFLSIILVTLLLEKVSAKIRGLVVFFLKSQVILPCLFPRSWCFY